MKEISKTTLLDQTLVEVKKYLFSGKVQPGDKMLTENQLVELLGVGRSTIREANKMLQAMGYIEQRPGKGAFVLSTEEKMQENYAIDWYKKNKSKVTDFLEFRLFLEPYVAGMAAEKITEAEIKKLASILEEFKKAYYANNLTALVTYEKAFHRTIFKAMHNSVFLEIYDQLIIFLNDFFTNSFSIEESTVQSLEPHQNIYKAIKDRNSILAHKEMKKHIELSISLAEKFLEK